MFILPNLPNRRSLFFLCMQASILFFLISAPAAIAGSIRDEVRLYERLCPTPRGSVDPALEAGCKQALEKYPSSFKAAYAYSTLGAIYFNRGQFREAAAMYEKSIAQGLVNSAKLGSSGPLQERWMLFRSLCLLNGGSAQDCSTERAVNDPQILESLARQKIISDAGAQAYDDRAEQRRQNSQQIGQILGSVIATTTGSGKPSNQGGQPSIQGKGNPSSTSKTSTSAYTPNQDNSRNQTNGASPSVNECMVLGTRQEPGYGKRKLTNTCAFTVEVKWCEEKAGSSCNSFNNQSTIPAGKSVTIWEGTGRVEWGACRGANSIHSSATSGLMFRCD